MRELKAEEVGLVVGGAVPVAFGTASFDYRPTSQDQTVSAAQRASELSNVIQSVATVK